VKRRAIIAVTFLAGLFYVLEFLLPTRIGGAPDADGATGATLVAADAANPEAQPYLAYTGLRNDGRPVILRSRTDGAGPRATLIAPHFARRDDYRGARSPQFVAPDRLYYIGLSWDDRKPCVCLATRTPRGWSPARRAVVAAGSPGQPDSSGIGWASVVRGNDRERPWRMWYVGMQGDRGAVHYADSADGLTWAKRGRVSLPGPDGDGVRCVNAVATVEGTALWLVVADRDGAKRVIVAWLRPDGLAARSGPDPVQLDLPPGMRVEDLRVTREESGIVAYAGLADGRGLVRVASLAPASRQFPEARLSVVNSALIVPGPEPRSTILSDIRTTVDDMLVVIGAFAVGLGLIGLARVHGKRIATLQRGWPESLAFFVAAATMTALTVYARLHPEARTWGSQGYNLAFYGLLQPLGSSMFSLLAAYLVSAAYRAFRVRSFEGALLAASALLIMLGQVPVGNWLTQHMPPYLQIPRVMAWVLFVNNTAVVRAVNFGIFVGALATALRVWLSMDRASMRSIE
jgi:hypothetical protein